MAKLTTVEAQELSKFDCMIEDMETMTPEQGKRYLELAGKWDDEMYEIRERQREIYDPRDDD